MVEPLTFPLVISAACIVVMTRFIYSWFRRESNEVFWPTIAHGTVNGGGFFALSILSEPENISIIIDLIGIVAFGIILIIQYYILDKKRV